MKKDQKGKCNPDDVALKTFFLGPQAENGPWLLDVLTQMFNHWFKWRQSLFPEDGRAISESDQNTKEFIFRRQLFENSLSQINRAFEDEVPKFSPHYVGHMFSEISLPALLGHVVTLLHNPNNISSESSRVGVKFEDEAIEALVKMVGYKKVEARGHFTSGGTLANFEALIRAHLRIKKWLSIKTPQTKSLFEAAHRGWKDFEKFENVETLITDTNPYKLAQFYEKQFSVPYLGPVLLVSDSRHYSWDKGLGLLGLGKDSLWGVKLDKFGRISLTDLERKIQRACQENRPVLMVTSVAGTTELGSVDDIQGVNDILENWQKRGINIWHHIDAAYGGFFKTLPEKSKSLENMHRANSITLDPHKLAYVPYSSGTFLCREEKEYNLNATSAPYIHYQVGKDRGPVTLEGSRSAGGAVATWMTSKCVGFDSDGYGRILERTILSAERLEMLLKKADSRIRVLPHRDTNIICFCIAHENEKISITNQRTLKIFNEFSPAGNNKYVVSKTSLAWNRYEELLDSYVSRWSAELDTESLHMIRLCIMNPFYDSKELKNDLAVGFVSRLCEII